MTRAARGRMAAAAQRRQRQRIAWHSALQGRSDIGQGGGASGGACCAGSAAGMPAAGRCGPAALPVHAMPGARPDMGGGGAAAGDMPSSDPRAAPPSPQGQAVQACAHIPVDRGLRLGHAPRARRPASQRASRHMPAPKLRGVRQPAAAPQPLDCPAHPALGHAHGAPAAGRIDLDALPPLRGLVSCAVPWGRPSGRLQTFSLQAALWAAD